MKSMKREDAEHVIFLTRKQQNMHQTISFHFNFKILLNAHENDPMTLGLYKRVNKKLNIKNMI